MERSISNYFVYRYNKTMDDINLFIGIKPI